MLLYVARSIFGTQEKKRSVRTHGKQMVRVNCLANRTTPILFPRLSRTKTFNPGVRRERNHRSCESCLRIVDVSVERSNAAMSTGFVYRQEGFDSRGVMEQGIVAVERAEENIRGTGAPWNLIHASLTAGDESGKPEEQIDLTILFGGINKMRPYVVLKLLDQRKLSSEQ